MADTQTMTSAALHKLRDREKQAHVERLATLADEHQRLTDLIPALKTTVRYRPEVVIRSEDGKSVLARLKTDDAITAEALPGTVSQFAARAVSDTLNGKRHELKETQYKRAKVEREIQSAREAWARRETEIERAIADANAEAAKRSAVEKDVAKHPVHNTAPRTMRDRLRLAGDFHDGA